MYFFHWEMRGFCNQYFYFIFIFLFVPTACGSFWARDQICITAVILQCSDKARFLSHCTTREAQESVLLNECPFTFWQGIVFDFLS